MGGTDAKPAVPRWLLLSTAAVGLLAGLLVLVVRYFEIQKAHAEAARARAALEERPPPPSQPPAARPVGPQADVKPPRPDPAPPPDPAADLAALQGEWAGANETVFGTKLSADEVVLKARRLKVAGKTFLMTRVEKNTFGQYEGDVVLFPAARPNKEFDFNCRDPNGKAIRFRGVYELTADRLRLAYPNPHAAPPLPRATGFDSPPGSPLIVLEFRRR